MQQPHHHSPERLARLGDCMEGGQVVMVSDTLGYRREGRVEVDILDHMDPVLAHTVPGVPGVCIHHRQLVALGDGAHTQTALLGDSHIPAEEAGQAPVAAGILGYRVLHSPPAVVVLVPVHTHHRYHRKKVADTQEADTAPGAEMSADTRTLPDHSRIRLDHRQPEGEGAGTSAVDPHIPVELQTPSGHMSEHSDAHPTLDFLDTAHIRALQGSPSRARGSGAYLSQTRHV